MTTEEVLNLIENLTATGYQHMDVSHEGTHILLSNTATVQPSAPSNQGMNTTASHGYSTENYQEASPVKTNASHESAVHQPSTNNPVDEKVGQTDNSINVAQEGTIIESPIVGTYYSAPTPEDDDFVAVGQQVKKGEVLCIIEAMKLMNEIEADRDGTILEILVTNEQGVEFGQPLFRIG